MNFGKWINKASLAGHLASDVHAAHLKNKLHRKLEAAKNEQRLRETYSAGESGPMNSVPEAAGSHLGMDNDTGRSPSPGPMDYVAAGLSAPVIPSFITPLVHNPSVERERLQEQVERMLAQAEQAQDDDDIALEDTMNTFKDLGLCMSLFTQKTKTHWALDLEDDEIDEATYFSNIPVDSNYSPYPNKSLALAFHWVFIVLTSF